MSLSVSPNEHAEIAVCDGLTWLRSHDAGGAAMVYFDPPYGHGTFGTVDLDWIRDVLAESWRVLTDDGIVYLHADPQLAWALRTDLPLRGQIAWKNGWVSGFKCRSTQFWPRQYQVVLGFAKDAWRLRPVQRPAEQFRATASRPKPSAHFVYSDWWQDPNPVDQMSFSQEKVGWPTQKPVALLERLIAGSTDPGDVVMDPACGSGTTIVAARRIKRLGFGADVDAAACEIAAARLNRRSSYA